MDLTPVFMFTGIIIVGALLFAVIGWNKKGPKHLDVVQYQKSWLAIEQQLSKDDISSYSLCVLNADKLLDKALKEKGMKGETMGDRLKSAKDMFSERDRVWSAHKLRNRIAHESDVNVTYKAARFAVGDFKRALRDIGAI